MVKKTQNEEKALFCVFIFKRFWGDSGERGGDARVEKQFLLAVPLSRKQESLMLLDIGASIRADRGAIRPCSGLNTPLFCHQKMAKILVN